MPRSAFSWQINRPLTAVTLLLLPLLVALGFWQLSRAEEKREAQRAFAELRAAPAQELSLSGQDLLSRDTLPNFSNLRVRGIIDNRRALLIDNRIMQGRFGYEVVSPLQLTGSGRWLLVNRGWVAADPGRRTLPDVPALEGEIELHGHLYRDQAGFELAGAEVATSWPRVVPHLDFAALGAALQIELLPYSLRLDAGSPGAQTVEWRVVNLGPEQHIGYAVQWFAMAVALLLAWLFASSNLWHLIRGAASAAPDGGERRDN